MPKAIHFEIHASDPDRLAKFYTEAFGWKIQHIPQMSYWLIDGGAGEGINGGMMKRHGAPPADGAAVNAFVCSLGVDSVDRSLASALAAGATIALPKMAIPGVGYQVYIKDPDNNIVGLHQADPAAK